MNKDRYMRVFRKSLACDKNKKNEICKDLEVDIQEALANNENWEDIQARLGTPQMLANEFHENLGIQHRGHRNKIIIAVLVLIAGLIGIFFYVKSLIPQTEVIGTSGYFSQAEVEEKTMDVIVYLNEHDYQAIYDMSNQRLQDVLSIKQLEDGISQLGELGEFEKITNQTYVELTQKNQINATGEIVALYQKRSVIYTISFDKDMNLSGIYMK